MDLVRIGAAFRAVRHRLGWRQRDVAVRAGVSTATVSRIERGLAGSFALATIERIAAVLEIRLDVITRWRGGELDRMLAAGHAGMHDAVARLLTESGWTFASECTFSVFGERGSIDILAFHPPSGSLLVIELKTQLVDVSELLAAVDRYRRLAPALGRERGWEVRAVSVWVVMLESRTNRRRVAAHASVLRQAYPADGRQVGAWLRAPVGTLSALSFLPALHPQTRRPGARRVRRPSSPDGERERS
jgi:transcriptional regulator with XRE-family HTH domain